MKKLFSVLVLAFACTVVFAQQMPQSTSYKDLKEVYNPKDFVKSSTDPYSVFWIGLESFAAPGVGQLVMKETKRGWIFLGSSLVLGNVINYCESGIDDLAKIGADGKAYIPDDDMPKAAGLLVGLVATAAVDLGLSIWSCVDAVKIAKVKNQYYQDLQKQSVSASLYPSVNMVRTGDSVTPAPGMTFALTF